MSYSSIQQATVDTALNERVIAAVAKEAWNGGPQFQDSDFGRLTRQNPWSAQGYMIWPVSIDYEAAYESALAALNPDPGGDPAVITDPNIQASVQAHWPADPWPPAAV